MDMHEAAAVVALSQREQWMMDDLPPGVDVEMLRCLDDRGLVEVQARYWQNHQPVPYGPSTRVVGVLPWCSPAQSPGMAGTWRQIAEHVGRDPNNLPYAVRLSERGLAEASRLARTPTVPSGPRSRLALTQKEVDRRIREYKSKHGVVYALLAEDTREGRPGAKEAARLLFGRNALARQLRISASAMVSKSPAWGAIKAELKLGEAGARVRRGGAQEGVDRASVNAGDQTTDAVVRGDIEARLDALDRYGPALRSERDQGRMSDAQLEAIVSTLEGRGD